MSAILIASGITKRYPGVVALDGVDLEVRAGEVHALVGENGAGKSTLVKVIAGVEQPDTGEMRLLDEPFAPKGASDALRAGVQVVHQELALLPYLTIAENLFLQRLPRRFGIVDRRAADRRARALLDDVGLDLSPRTKVEHLGIAQMQLVEIAKALSAECRLLVMDEPTATLTPHETTALFRILRRLTASGVGVVYISHHLEEVFETAQRVTVLRNGRRVATHPIREVSTADLVREMVGRDLAHEYPPVAAHPLGDELLNVDRLKLTPISPELSLTVRAGEVVGVAGLVGSGRTEMVRAIFGADPVSAGTIRVRGRVRRMRHPLDAVRAGISLLTEDRKSQGLVLDLSIAANVSLADLRAVGRYGLMRRAVETRLAERMTAQLHIKAASTQQHVRALSGGNQQKVVLGRWLAADADLLIVDEPTRGIDVGARYEIHQLLRQLAESGKAVLVVSSDLPELLGICDRLLVMSRGRLVGELQRDEFDAERVLTLAYSEYLTSQDAPT